MLLTRKLIFSICTDHRLCPGANEYFVSKDGVIESMQVDACWHNNEPCWDLSKPVAKCDSLKHCGARSEVTGFDEQAGDVITENLLNETCVIEGAECPCHPTKERACPGGRQAFTFVDGQITRQPPERLCVPAGIPCPANPIVDCTDGLLKCCESFGVNCVCAKHVRGVRDGCPEGKKSV
jgi:hypothetical protein